MPYQNRLPIVSMLLEEYPNNTRLYKFIADPPTTTMQRLKALTTGSLPTFVDAGSNFATQEITEDNIIDQMVSNRYSAVFTGDDTWALLYPNRFLRNFSYPSFDVWDLNTVDNGVKEQIFSELKKQDWNLLIGHFLGVDHCGHRYGPNHPEMERKLLEINSVVENVVKELPHDTMLFVVGDHGMTSTGDHGGESLDEITAGMFVYSKRVLQSFGEKSATVKQIDLIPTLSTLLGIPIPFQNLGIIILDVLPNSNDFIGDWHGALFALWENAKQIRKYFVMNSEGSNVVNASALNFYLDIYSHLQNQISALDSKEEFLRFHEAVRLFLNDIRSLHEEAWVRFDRSLMNQGLLTLFLSLVLVFIISDGLPKKTLDASFAKSVNLLNFMTLIMISAASIIVLWYDFPLNTSSNILAASGAFFNIFLVHLIIRNWNAINFQWSDSVDKENVIDFVGKTIIAFNLCMLFSNSFINEESGIQLFSLISIVLLSIVSTCSCYKVHSKNKLISVEKLISKVKIFSLSLAFTSPLRASMYFWRCRLEQDWCYKSSENTGPAWYKQKPSMVQWVTTGVFLVLFILSTKDWLKRFGNLTGFSGVVLITKYIPTVIVLCTSGFWVLDQLPVQQTNLKGANYLALSVYGFVVFSVTILFLSPLCIYILPKDSLMSAPFGGNKFHRIYQKLKIYLTNTKLNQDALVVYGLKTVHSAAFLLLGIYIVLLFTLLLGVATAPSAIIMFSTLCFVLVITSVWRIGRATQLGDLLNVPNYCVITWTVLSQYFFYATGHQPTFPNINWEAAFVGTSGLTRNNFLLGTLIVINTFCSNILMGMLLPLLVISPFTIMTALPSVFTNKDELFKAYSKGEMMLFEQENQANASMFILACKYLAAHGLRVLFSMVSATINCRHLMVSSIFAPKLIFESTGMFATIASVLFGYCLFHRVNVRLSRLMTKHNESS